MRDPGFEAHLLGLLAGPVPPFLALGEPLTRRYTTDRDILRPSGMGNCPRRLALEVQALPFERTIEALSMDRMDFGTHMHAWIQGLVPGRHEVKVASMALAGSLDTLNPDGRVLDYKSIDQKGFKAVVKADAAREDHKHQVNWYCAQTPAQMYTVVYVGKSGPTSADISPETLACYTYPVDVARAAEWDLLATEIRDHAKAGSLPVYEAVLACRWCPVQAACWARLPGETEFGTKINGSTFRGQDGNLVLSRLVPGQELRLEHEPSNEYGSRITDDMGAAVKVMWGPLHLGYLPDEGSGARTAQVVARHLMAGGRAKAMVKEITGGRDGAETYGCNLTILLST